MPRILKSTRKDKKFMVKVKGKTVHFGDPNLSIKRDDPARRKAFNKRFRCNTPGPKDKPRFWACKSWNPRTKLP